MRHRWAMWVGAVVCVLSTTDPSRAGAPESGTAPSRRAALLASHGEPRLAWDELRAAGKARTDADAALAIRLLTELGRYAQAESLLARDAAPKSDAAALWYYLQRGRLNLDAGRADRALEMLDAVRVTPGEPLGAYVEFVRAQALNQKGDAPGAVAALDRARTPATPEALVSPIDEERVRVLRMLGRPSDALAALDDGIARAVDGTERRRLLAERYEVAVEAGDEALATTAALALLEEHKNFPEAQ